VGLACPPQPCILAPPSRMPSHGMVFSGRPPDTRVVSPFLSPPTSIYCCHVSKIFSEVLVRFLIPPLSSFSPLFLMRVFFKRTSLKNDVSLGIPSSARGHSPRFTAFPSPIFRRNQGATYYLNASLTFFSSSSFAFDLSTMDRPPVATSFACRPPITSSFIFTRAAISGLADGHGPDDFFHFLHPVLNGSKTALPRRAAKTLSCAWNDEVTREKTSIPVPSYR